ncbi:MAG: FHA domain-containing protein [Lachnospiraceae bacterium]|nr:FHA domain-containing protein [Lachnospiraceae bacterium]
MPNGFVQSLHLIFGSTTPQKGVLDLLLLVVNILILMLITSLVLFVVGRRRTQTKSNESKSTTWQKYGTVPPEYVDGKPQFGTTSLLKPYHSEYPDVVVPHDGNEKTSLLDVDHRGLVVMRMRTEEEFLVGKDTFLMGKERVRVDYCITANPAVSRTHARLTRKDGKLYIEDMNATNGTYVNGERIRPGNPVPLEVGDRFRLADEEFQVR